MPYTNVGWYHAATFNPKDVGIGFWVYLIDSTDPNHTLGLILLDHSVRWVALAQESTNSSTPTASETGAIGNM